MLTDLRIRLFPSRLSHLCLIVGTSPYDEQHHDEHRFEVWQIEGEAQLSLIGITVEHMLPNEGWLGTEE